MDPSLSKEGVAPVRDRLVTTLFLAALFHGIVILGVSFGVSGLPESDAAPTLEVLLVNEQMPEALDNPGAVYLAQRNQQGSGNSPDGRTSNPAASALAFDNPGSDDGQALTEGQTGQSSQAASVVAVQSTQGPRPGEATDANSGVQQKALLMHSGPTSPLPSADDGRELTLKGKYKDELLLTADTREAAVAVYLDGWKRKVERVGTLHFPMETRRRGKSGNPVLEVVIRSNGRLEEVVVTRSSGHAELDQAAMAILRLAAPFDPFPPELRKRHPVARVRYEWQFIGGKPVDSTIKSR